MIIFKTKKGGGAVLYSDYLEHYGVKGMEWGKKKKQTLSSVPQSTVSAVANQFFKSAGLKSPLAKTVDAFRTSAATTAGGNLVSSTKKKIDAEKKTKEELKKAASGVAKSALKPVGADVSARVSTAGKSAVRKKEVVSGIRSGVSSTAAPVAERIKTLTDSAKAKKGLTKGVGSGVVKTVANKTATPLLKTVKSELGTVTKIRDAIGKANIASVPRNFVSTGQNAISKMFKRKTK